MDAREECVRLVFGEDEHEEQDTFDYSNDMYDSNNFDKYKDSKDDTKKEKLEFMQLISTDAKLSHMHLKE